MIKTSYDFDRAILPTGAALKTFVSQIFGIVA